MGCSLIILFGPTNERFTQKTHNDALVITVEIGGHDVARTFVDTESSVDIISQDFFTKMNLSEELEPIARTLYGFMGGSIQPRGQILLQVRLGEPHLQKTKMVNVLVIDTTCEYNMILERPSLNSFQHVVSTYHMKLKFPAVEKFGEIVGDQLCSRKCYVKAIKKVAHSTSK